ncbi:DNA polymerase III subunit beta [Patescibacteria group bacterium]|nr:DNA polymerase III subunit beta [Patescibacteria group bacterium]
MKVSCKRENILKALNSLSRVVTTSSTLPILGNVLVKTDQGRMKLSATDLEMGVNFWLGAKIEEEGEVTIPARIFVDYINNNSDENIDIGTDGQVVVVNSDHYSTKINGLAADEFPIIPRIKEEPVFEMMVETLQDAVSKVVFAASTGETNPTLAGVLFRSDKDNLKVVATDSYRLAERVIKLKKVLEKDLSVIVPTKTVAELNRMLSNSMGEVGVYVSDNQIMFRVDDMEIVSRLVEGNYPAYESIMPTGSVTRVVVGTKELLRDTKMAAVFSRETQKIKLMVDKDVGMLKSLSKGQTGENISKMEVEVEGASGEITFNTRYLSDVLAVVDSSKIILEMTDKLKPGLVKPLNDDLYRYIIMPVKD